MVYRGDEGNAPGMAESKAEVPWGRVAPLPA